MVIIKIKKIIPMMKVKILTNDFAIFMGNDGKIYHGEKWKKGQTVTIPKTQALRFIKQGRAVRHPQKQRKK